MLSLIPKLKSKQQMFLVRYLLSVFIFAVLYYVAHYYIEDYSDKKKYTFGDFLYFSMGTQSSLGYGDIVANHPISRILVSLQMLSAVVIIIDAVL